MLVVGLTGDVGAGKSTVGRIWREMGAVVLDADAVAKGLWAEPDVLEQATSRWGGDILDDAGRLVPSHVASIVFGNPDEYRWLCELLHPRVRVRMQRSVETSEGWLVAEIPLLYEGGVPWWVDMEVYVVAPRANRVARNVHRNWDASEIERRESCLLPRQEKISRAHLVIENTGTLKELKGTLETVAREMKAMASIAELFIRFEGVEEASRFGSMLSARQLAAELSISTSAGLEGTGTKTVISGTFRNHALPEIRNLLEDHAAGPGTLWTRPLRHMDLTSLRRLSGELAP